MSSEPNETRAPGSHDASPDRVELRALPETERVAVSRYFSWHEVIVSETAERLGIDNTPGAQMLDAIAFTAMQMDRVRKLLGAPVLVSSWFRARDVNIMVGGACTIATLRAALDDSPHLAVRERARERLYRGEVQSTDSQHTTGAAIDFRCPGYGAPRQIYDYLRPLAIDLSIDQLILEYPERPRPWVHASFSATPRHMAWVESDARMARAA